MTFTLHLILLLLATMLTTLPGHLYGEDSQPVMDVTPLNVTVNAGTATTLSCIVNTIFRGDKLNVIWVNPGRHVITSGERRIIMDRRFSVSRHYDPEWNLHVSNVRPEDAGLYMCQVNTDPIQIKRVHLHVRVPPLIRKSDDVVTPEGSMPVLFCNATGEPQPSVMWFKGEEHIISDGEMLRFVNITREQSGKYRCLAFNRVEPNAEEYINVKVQYKPEVRLLNQRIRQYLGKSVLLDCIVKAKPHGTVSWTKNGLPLPDEKWKYGTTMFDGDGDMITLQLRIMMLEKSDFGFYTCEASNIMGKSQATMELLELESTTSKPEVLPTKSQLPATHLVPFLIQSTPNSNLATILETRYNPNEIFILHETGSSQKGNTGKQVITAPNNGGKSLQTSNTGLVCIIFVMVNKLHLSCGDFS